MIKQILIAVAFSGINVPAQAATKPDNASIVLKQLAGAVITDGHEFAGENYKIVIGSLTPDLQQEDLAPLAEGFTEAIDRQSSGKEQFPAEISFLKDNSKTGYAVNLTILKNEAPLNFTFKAAACYTGTVTKENLPELMSDVTVPYRESSGALTLCVAAK